VPNRVTNRVTDRLFAWLTGVQLCLLLDMAFDWRWKIHDFWMREAMMAGVYDRRRLSQVLVLGLLCLAAALASRSLLLRFRRKPGAALAMTGTLLSVVLWCCEWVSFHWADQVFYHMIGKLMVVSLLWIGLALMTGIGAWLDGRRDIILPSRR
jgi:hypothetical protein